MSKLVRLQGSNDDQVKRWLWLRAVEWTALPSFLSQPVAPVLFNFFPWHFVILSVFILAVVWCFIRYSFISVRFAKDASVAVAVLKWPASVVSSLCLFIDSHPVPAFMALLWPLIAGFVAIPGKVGRIELALAEKIGYVSPEAKQ